jgi:hypothetical protein
MASNAVWMMATRIIVPTRHWLARIGSRLAHLGKPSDQPSTTRGPNVQLRR